MKSSIIYAYVALIGAATAQEACVEGKRVIISRGYTVEYKCDKFRLGQRHNNVPSHEVCATKCQVGNLDVCTYHSTKKICIVGDLDGKEGTSIGATYMIRVEEEPEAPFPEDDPFAETCEEQRDDLQTKLDKCHAALEAPSKKPSCSVNMWGPNFYIKVEAKSLASCKDICNTDPKCLSYCASKSKTDNCYLYDKETADLGDRMSGDPQDWVQYDKRCHQLSAHDLENHQCLEAASEDKCFCDESIRDLQAKVDAANAHDADIQAKLLAEEKAKRAAEAELEQCKLQLDETNKPKLPNTVTLSNPIPIIGSLGGASDNYDDRFYPLASSFPVTIYGHSSTNLFVSINGLLSIDVGNQSHTHQPLPFRNALFPQYTLLPFWGDLYIYKDTPQGIYYEVTGQAPSRSLTIEWYVSRYKDPSQYYHFLVILEEAKPNIVTYKYIEAKDKGAKCTIGAQGPNSAQQWSYNEAKALPGVQVTIDTASGSVSQSTFPVNN